MPYPRTQLAYFLFALLAPACAVDAAGTDDVDTDGQAGGKADGATALEIGRAHV